MSIRFDEGDPAYEWLILFLVCHISSILIQHLGSIRDLTVSCILRHKKKYGKNHALLGLLQRPPNENGTFNANRLPGRTRNPNPT